MYSSGKVVHFYPSCSYCGKRHALSAFNNTLAAQMGLADQIDLDGSSYIRRSQPRHTFIGLLRPSGNASAAGGNEHTAQSITSVQGQGLDFGKDDPAGMQVQPYQGVERQTPNVPESGFTQQTALETELISAQAGFLESVAAYLGSLLNIHCDTKKLIEELRSFFESEKEREMHGSDKSDSRIKGLFHYQRWWNLSEVGVSARNGDMLTGVPIYTDENTLRVVNDDFSYFIPMQNIDYIRTDDGLKAARESFER